MLRRIHLIILLCIVGFIPTLEGYSLDFDLVGFTGSGTTLNAVCFVPGPTIGSSDNRYFAVGDRGWVYILKNDGRSFDDSLQLPNGGPEYNLSGVSGFRYGTGSQDVLVIVVGNKRDSTATGPKWKGAIWRSTDRGGTWTRVPENGLPPEVKRVDAPVPFLDVKVVNRNNAWVSCGNGYVMKSTDGGVSWSLTPRKPVRPGYMGWFWGIYAPSANEAWVCSDESTLVARTTDGGINWIIYTPFASDSLSYRDICGDKTRPGTIYLAASKGYLVYTRNNGASWFKSDPLEMETNAEWLRGVFRHALPSPPFLRGDTLVWCVGTGGIIANEEDGDPLYWYSRRYDFNAVDGGCASMASQRKFTYVAVGTNRAIMCIEVDTAPYISSERRQRNAQEELRVYDTPNDNGWHVYGDWDSFPNASRWYRLYILPANDANNHYLREETDWGKRIGQFHLNQRSFTYDSILIGHSTTFTLTTWDEENNEETDIAWVDTFSSDNLAPRDIVSGLRGRYVSDLRAILLHWEPYPTGAEPNLGGYWVCPVVEGQYENISHLSPLLRNYYLESIPGGISRIGVKVQAMDRSGQRGPWQPEYYWISIPPVVLSPWATAFNQGRHLVRLSETKALYMVYENEGKVFYRYSGDNGEYWSEEEIGYGYYPSIGVDQKGLPWVVFWREGDIVCKVKKPDGFWKEIIVYDGNNTSWAGAPAIAMGTLPKEGIIPIPQPFAYITYPVYQGEGIPEIPAPGPYPSSYNCIMLSILDTVSIVNYLIDEGDANNPVSDPAVAVTPADLLHLVWQKGGEIWYTTNYNKLSYNNWQEAQFQDKVNISESPEVLSQHPFIEAYGENVICAWKEGEPGEIYRRVRKLSSPTMAGNDWSGIENISQSPDKESDYPVLSTLDVCAYQERVDSLNYEIFAWIKGERINLSETENSSKYPHIAVEPPTVSDASGTIIIEPKIIIDAIWTEKLSESLYYEVRFKRYEYNPSSPPTEYISVAIGESIPSPYCEQRDGVIDYGEFSCDYSSSSLIYNLPYFNPNSTYLLFAVVYKEAPQTWREEIYLDSNFITEVFYYPYLPETLNIILPKESYENDLAIRKEIERILGNYALIAELKVFEVSLPESLQGGGQSLRNRMVLRPVLYQNRPNPFKNLTNISFAIPKESYVSLIIYDASGRKVRSLIRERLKAGSYNQKWDGRDDGGKEMPQGVYFYQLKTQNFKEIKKAVLLR